MFRSDTTIRRGLRVLLGVFLVAQGINHFVLTDFFVRAIPGWLPWPLFLVYLSGIAEIGLGIAVLVPRTRILAGWGIVALLLAVFPANIEMALHPDEWPEVSSVLLWIRLPFQALFIYWVWACVLVVMPRHSGRDLASLRRARSARGEPGSVGPHHRAASDLERDDDGQQRRGRGLLEPPSVG